MFTRLTRFGRDFERWWLMQSSRWSGHFVVLTGAALALGSYPAGAQTNLLAPSNAPIAALDVVPEVGDADLATLSLPAFGAVSLRASSSAMQAAPASTEALRQWVGRGNVVFLHTDAAQLFGMQTVPARTASADAGSQLVGRARAALPFGSHPLLLGATEAGAAVLRGADPTRLPGVQTVFYSLRAGDALLESSDVATPLLQVDDANTDANRPLYAAAIESVGAGWAIFCPDTLDSARGQGAQFGRALRSFVPDQGGARFVGLPSRVLLGSDASPASVGTALQNRLNAALQSDGRAALPGFGTVPAQVPVPIETGSEAVLPLERGEAQAILGTLGGPDETAVVALLAARMRWQLGQSARSAQALNVAALDPNMAPQVSFWNGCFQAQIAADVSLDAPSRALSFNGAARAFSLVGQANFAPGTIAGASFTNQSMNSQGFNGVSQTAQVLNGQVLNGQVLNGQVLNGQVLNGQVLNGQVLNGQVLNGQVLNGAARGFASLSLPVAPFVAASWSREFARLAAVYTLAPPQSQFIVGNGTSATLRFYGADSGARAAAALLQGALNNADGPRASHIEVLLVPTLGAYGGVRRALSAPTSASLPGGEVVGTTLLLASGEIGAMGQGQNADAATLARGLALANLNSWTDGTRSLPAWIIAGAQTRAVGLGAQGTSSATNFDTLEAILSGQAPASAGTANALWRFLINRYGSGAAEELVARLTAGASVDQALQAATGDDIGAFINAFQRA